MSKEAVKTHQVEEIFTHQRWDNLNINKNVSWGCGWGMGRPGLMVIGLTKTHYTILSIFGVYPIFYMIKSFKNICNL